MTDRQDPLRALSNRRSHLALLAGAASTLFVSGCSALSGSEGGDSGGGSNGKLEKTKIKIGALPVIDLASPHRAKSAGYFEQEGLDVSFETIQGGAIGVPKIISGDLDATWTSWNSVISAQSQGVAKFKIINPGIAAKAKTFVVMSKPGSPVQEPKDLEGHTLAVPTRNSIAELTARSALRVKGGDDSKIKFVEIPFPAMIPALKAGRVDSIYLAPHFITVAQRELGAKIVLDCATGPTDGIATSGMVVTEDYANKNPNTVAALRRAMDHATRDILADRKTLEDTVLTYVNVDPQTVKIMDIQQYLLSVNKTRLQRVADLMQQFGVIKQKFDVSPMILPNV